MQKLTMNIKENDLSSLRLTILKHQWKESYQLASMLLAQNLPQCTVLVADQVARSCLRFQSRYDLGWITRFAQEVIQFIQESRVEDEVPKLPQETGETFADAPYGVGNLVGGVVELWRSISVAHNTDEKAKHLANAINRFITAEIGNYWETVHPEEVQLRETFSNAETTTEGRKLLPDIDMEKLYRGIGFLKQPESIGYHSARLLSIVDEIELILGK